VTTRPTDEGALPSDLVEWVAATAQGRVTGAVRVPGGGRRQAWFIDVARTDSGDLDALFLRFDPKDADDPADPFTLHREAQFYRALADSDVPVPRIFGVHPVHQAILSSRVTGVAAFSRLRDVDAQQEVARDFMRCLSALHRIDPARLELPGEPLLDDLRPLVRREIAVWERLYRENGTFDPLAELAFRYLRENVPDVPGPIVIVQGDTGPGNFLYENGAVTAVLDWELGHYGDPMEDLGWLSLRAVQDPFTNLADRIAEYAEQVSYPVDYDRIRYYRVFAELRVVVLGLQRVKRPDLTGEVAGGLIFGALHRRLCVEALADVLGIALDDVPELSATVPPHDWLYEATLTQIRDIIVPGSTDPFVAARTKGLARVLKYLRELDQRGGALEAAERNDLAELVGHEVTDLDAARVEFTDLVAAQGVDAAATLRYLARRSARETELMAGSMGALASRHLDPLPTQT
jgi:aminoglycoside phosphotransferase (APT) family kinase protein